MQVRSFLLFIFAISSTVLYGQLTDFDSTDFLRADSIARTYTGYDLKDPEQLAQQLTKDLPTDVEKFRAIFKWICNEISYDVEGYHELVTKKKKLQAKRDKLIKWQKKFHVKLYSRVIDEKLALCSGYSYLLERMSRSIGLNCVTIEGYARDDKSRIGHLKLNHAWNAVQLGTKWYLVDPTWASGYVNPTITQFNRWFSGEYFLTDPYYFLAGHYPAKPSWTLLYDNPTLREFQKSPIKTDGFLRYKVNQLYPAEGLIKIKVNSQVEFKFTSNHKKCPQEVKVAVATSKSTSEFKYKLEKNTKGELWFSHAFAKKGYYRVSIYLGRTLAFVYEANVT